MSLVNLHIANFKGVGEATNIEIKPLTVFFGANSSGKSTCIHALASLSQTTKLSNNSLPLVLDDEFANVHLGRFIEVIHSKSYQHYVTLGMKLKDAHFYEIRPTDKGTSAPRRTRGDITFEYSFKCSQRTQDIRIAEGTISIGDHQFSVSWVKDNRYQIINNTTGEKTILPQDNGFVFNSNFSVGRDRNESLIPFIQAQKIIQTELKNCFYLGPFRDAPRRKYETRSAKPIEVGPLGEAAITMLANESFQTQKRSHIKQISGWLEKLGLASSLKINRVGKSDLVDVKLGLSDGDEFPIADLGYGISQILPVLTQCSFSPKKSVLLFEQPEIHLHTKSAKQLASVFIETIKEKESTIIFETHAPEIIKQIIQECKNGVFDLNDFAAYQVYRNNKQTCIKKIEITEEFDVYENWESQVI